jgi:hypothetical protein
MIGKAIFPDEAIDGKIRSVRCRKQKEAAQKGGLSVALMEVSIRLRGTRRSPADHVPSHP